MSNGITVGYRVIWVIDVDASSPREAAEEAQDLMQMPTTATVFIVSRGDKSFEVDLDSGIVKEVPMFADAPRPDEIEEDAEASQLFLGWEAP